MVWRQAARSALSVQFWSSVEGIEQRVPKSLISQFEFANHRYSW